ncbi:MAG: SAM-dependent chlorinase/fluorinase [Acidimicrobiia bacterium]|nr:MAG: SAM-dependent chlorinase/fluorinase [Acidimicrobiia bacterium]
MPLPISFLSDFGHDDEFVGVVHGVIARIAPDVRVIDIGHDFPRGDVQTASLALLRSVQYLPEGVALAVVDPGVGTDRLAIAARTPWGVFVGPNNGVLAPAVAMVGGADLIVSIEAAEFRLPVHGATFDGRDLFAPAAAVLASAEAEITDLGPPVDPGEVVPMMIPLVEEDAFGAIQGEVLWVDHFGNAQTNGTPEDLSSIGLQPGSEVSVVIAGAEQRLPWVDTYGALRPSDALLHVDSYGQIAVAVRDGRADETFGLGVGTPVIFRKPADDELRIVPADD